MLRDGTVLVRGVTADTAGNRGTPAKEAGGSMPPLLMLLPALPVPVCGGIQAVVEDAGSAWEVTGVMVVAGVPVGGCSWA